MPSFAELKIKIPEVRSRGGILPAKSRVKILIIIPIINMKTSCAPSRVGWHLVLAVNAWRTKLLEREDSVCVSTVDASRWIILS